MAPKASFQLLKLTSFLFPDATNIIAIEHDCEANPRYKCFTRFIDALFARPTPYILITFEEIALQDGQSNIFVTCKI